MLAYNYTFVFENINLSSSVKIKTTDIIHPAFNWADLKAKNLQKKGNHYITSSSLMATIYRHTKKTKQTKPILTQKYNKISCVELAREGRDGGNK